jgi:hypothetical protein
MSKKGGGHITSCADAGIDFEEPAQLTFGKIKEIKQYLFVYYPKHLAIIRQFVSASDSGCRLQLQHNHVSNEVLNCLELQSISVLDTLQELFSKGHYYFYFFSFMGG